ncbi:MAG: hypothetical protein OHK006_08260 [Thermodesulfovibrionales bacterium]
MAHSFTVMLTKDLESVLRHAEALITGNGGRFEGDTSKGTFQGRTVAGVIKGAYSAATAKEITITITDKPFIVPYSMIETEIRKYFG